MLEFICKDFCDILPYVFVQDLPGLRISPLGVVPQQDCHPRLIVDYNFSGINQDTVKLAPPKAMQFGCSLDCILHAIVESPFCNGPVYMLKIDLADGFYCIHIHPQDAPKLALAMPWASMTSLLLPFCFCCLQTGQKARLGSVRPLRLLWIWQMTSVARNGTRPTTLWSLPPVPPFLRFPPA